VCDWIEDVRKVRGLFGWGLVLVLVVVVVVMVMMKEGRRGY